MKGSYCLFQSQITFTIAANEGLEAEIELIKISNMK